MIEILNKKVKQDVYTIHAMSIYPGRKNVNVHKIKGNMDQCVTDLREIMYHNVIGNYCYFIGHVYVDKVKLELMEDKETIDYLHKVAVWMTEDTDLRFLERVCKQVMKLKKKLISIIHALGKNEDREVELLNLIKTCEQVIEGEIFKL